MDANNITDNNNIMDTNITNIKSIKKKHSFKKKKKARPILSQHGGAKYDLNNHIGIYSPQGDSLQLCWFDSIIQMLCKIDCLCNYIGNNSAEIEATIKGYKPISQENKRNKEEEEKRSIIEVFNSNYKDFAFDFMKANFNNLEINEFEVESEPDNITTKINMILALRSIILRYYNTIYYINDHSNQFQTIQDQLKDEFFTSDTEKFNDMVKKHKFFASMDTSLKYKKVDNTEENPAIEFNSYMSVKTGDNNPQKDAKAFIKFIFLLFEDIDDVKLIKLTKCFRCVILSKNDDNTQYNIISTSIIDISIIEDNKDDVTNLQDKINTTYIASKNKRLILFPETKFIVFAIQRINDVDKRSILKANATIDITGNKYKLRGCIIHSGDKAGSGHESFIAYNDKGAKAVLLNGTFRTDLTTINPDHFKGAVNHVAISESYDPDTRGYIYLYELDEPGEVAKADAKADTVTMATTLGAAIAVGTDTSQPDTNVAAALTATLAATQVGPDAIEEENVPAALTATLAATQLPAPTQPPTQPTTDRSNHNSQQSVAAGLKDRDIKDRDIKDIKDRDIRDIKERDIKERDIKERDIKERDIKERDAKPPVEVKPYSGSLEPSSDSNGENMVLGILLVITLAISGVLFVQR